MRKVTSQDWTPAVEAVGLGKRYGDAWALREISFSLRAGASLALIGPSGSGKTTLLRLVAGLDEPEEGQLDLDGRPASRAGYLVSPGARGVAMAFQRPALWPHMTVQENVRFGLRRWEPGAARQRLDEVLCQLSLDPLKARYPHQLSGGEAQRASIARAVAPARPILLLDEPFTHFDPDLAESALAVLKEESASRRITLVVACHDAGTARSLCSEALILKEGRLRYLGAWEGPWPAPSPAPCEKAT